MCLVSVCVATYNGSLFIEEQLASILAQIPIDSEVLIGDDGSTDDTIRIIESFNDPRVKVIRNPSNFGYIKNFENLLGRAQGDYIFFSDQDDVWPLGRVEAMISAMLTSRKLLVVGSTEYFERNIEVRYFFCGFGRDRDNRHLVNLLDLMFGRNVPYFGCSMLLSKELKSSMLPFYSYSISHDIWSFFVAGRCRSVCHLENIVTYRRIHTSNLSNKKRRWLQKVKTRLVWLAALVRLI